MAKYIKHQLFLAHPPKAVWEYLTDPELIQQWLMKTDFKPVIGHQFQFTAGCSADLDFSGIIDCKVVDVVPYERLSYTWLCSSMTGRVTTDSVVNWTLVPKYNGTELLLEHNGFKILENLPLFQAMEAGWVQHMNTMNVKLNETAHGHTTA